MIRRLNSMHRFYYVETMFHNLSVQSAPIFLPMAFSPAADFYNF